MSKRAKTAKRASTSKKAPPSPPTQASLDTRLHALREAFETKRHALGAAELDTAPWTEGRAEARWRTSAARALGRDLSALELGLRVRGLPLSRIAAGLALVEAALGQLASLTLGEKPYAEAEHHAVFHDFTRPTTRSER